MSAKKPIAIKLLCPSLSKVVRLLVASDEQRIDLGSIARDFGLDPSTIKLNGHFISRGVDLVASSVTWKSLLSFFSAKGLPTGKDDGDALDVTGKLCKAGNKRGHDSQYAGNEVCKEIEGENFGSSGGTQEIIDLLKNKKFRESNPVIMNGLGCKRKQLCEDSNLFKKLKINDTTDSQDQASVPASDISGNQFTCRNANKNLKRIRDEAIVAAHCKRIR
ncbi:uncharacterized protein LOC129288947 [Prosopis cineraria]|uniref:uncharacterized protein LOC129288947 n=1 Tax=Prosopis cineraria TaxID=364024 RepID=UPI00240F2E55|nr:uncharacterized protein LOC129288947 [Prosopis cineraria]